MIIELVSATDGSTGITGSKALLLLIISKHSVEMWMAFNIMGAAVKTKKLHLHWLHLNQRPLCFKGCLIKLLQLVMIWFYTLRWMSKGVVLLWLFHCLRSEVFQSGNENSFMILLKRRVYSSFLISEWLGYKANNIKVVRKWDNIIDALCSE